MPAPADPALRKIYDGPDMTLFERDSALPRFFTVARALAGGIEAARVSSRETLSHAVFVASDVHDRLSRGGGAARRGVPFGS